MQEYKNKKYKALFVPESLHANINLSAAKKRMTIIEYLYLLEKEKKSLVI